MQKPRTGVHNFTYVTVGEAHLDQRESTMYYVSDETANFIGRCFAELAVE